MSDPDRRQQPPPSEQLDRGGGPEQKQAEQLVEQLPPAEMAADLVVQADAEVDGIKDIPDKLAGEQADKVRAVAGSELAEEEKRAREAGERFDATAEKVVGGAAAQEAAGRTGGEHEPTSTPGELYKMAMQEHKRAKEELARIDKTIRDNPSSTTEDQARLQEAHRRVEETAQIVRGDHDQALAEAERGPLAPVLRLLDLMTKVDRQDLQEAERIFKRGVRESLVPNLYETGHQESYDSYVASEAYAAERKKALASYEKNLQETNDFYEQLLQDNPEPAMEYIENQDLFAGRSRFDGPIHDFRNLPSEKERNREQLVSDAVRAIKEQREREKQLKGAA